MNEESEIDYILSAEAVRQRGEEMLAWALQGHSHFAVDLEQVETVADDVVATTRERYPELDVPLHSRWCQFQVGGHDRAADVAEALEGYPADEGTRARVDLATVSVLLDVTPGPQWSYRDEATGMTLSGAEGVAVASLRMFLEGLFSAHRPDPCRVDAARLTELDVQQLQEGFQVSDANPLAGLEGRLALLHRLGEALRSGSTGFPEPRPGALFDTCAAAVAGGGSIPAEGLLRVVLVGLHSIWPSRTEWEGDPLGDVSYYEPFGAADDDGALVPLHRMAQWLTFALIEPLSDGGIDVIELDGLTGLADAHNGALLLDHGLLALRDPSLADRTHPVDSQLVVEWRALTVALLDRVAAAVRRELKVKADAFPLLRVLEGGTWWAGRASSQELRAGDPPLRVVSDGTVL